MKNFLNGINVKQSFTLVHSGINRKDGEEISSVLCILGTLPMKKHQFVEGIKEALSLESNQAGQEALGEKSCPDFS